ncbi:MAG: glycyl-radical enzyme activating protein [Ruminococcaceae bacterium]|nr:glycyl-radical enzyme activating protein [Oscillospiraceae bacterium]
MKGLISGIKRMEIHDGDGLRTTVFFKGCPLKCIWCHNPESISTKKQVAFFKNKCIGCNICGGKKTEETAQKCPSDAIVLYGTEYEEKELCEVLIKDKLFFEKSGGGVTLSGGECLMQGEFAVNLAKELYKKGISVYIDTCGFVKQDIFKKIIPYTDKFLYDIKAINPDVHKKYTGCDNKIILENLKFLLENNCNIEIRYPLVTNYNDKECKHIGKFLKDLKGISKVKVLKYHPFAASRYDALNMECTMPDTETTNSDVENAVQTLKKYGLNAVNGAVED